MIRNILFDWSGTLVDDLPAVWRATNHVFRQAGVPEMTLDAFRDGFALPFRGFYERWVPHVPLARLEVWFHDHYSQAQESVQALRHAREFMEFCRLRGLRTFVLSTIRQDYFHQQAGRLGFAGCFEAVYLEAIDKRDFIGRILRDHGLAPNESLFVGDMQHDVETARHGGVWSCAVLTGYTPLGQLRDSQPDLIVEHLAELQALLTRQDLSLPVVESGANRPPDTAADGVGVLPDSPVVTVGALIYNAKGEVLLVRTRKWSDRWGIPGGKVKAGETSLDALRREIKEETDLDIAHIRFALVQDCIHSPEFYRRAHFVLLNYTACATDSAAVRLNDEAQAYQWVAPQDSLQMDLNQPTRRLLEAVLSERASAVSRVVAQE